MIPPLVFSLLAFFVVITTTVVVITNKAKVNNINHKITETSDKINKNKHDNNTKLQNLVNEVNYNYKKLETNQKNTKDELDLKQRRTDEKHNNLDRRFNSYKNITTANFVAMNNRFEEDNRRLQDEIQLNKDRIAQNKLHHETSIRANLEKIEENRQELTNFVSNSFNPIVNNLQTVDNNLIGEISRVESNLLGATIESSNMTVDARRIIQNDVIGKYNRVNDSLTNFFNMNNQRHLSSNQFIEDTYLQTSNTDLFRNWFDRYYDINGRANFSNLDEMLLAADESMNTVRSHGTQINTINDTLVTHGTQLNSNNNLYKNDLHSFVQEQYDFNLTDLKNIASNANHIVDINSRLVDLNSTLSNIGIFDVTVGGTITLEQLNSNIQANRDMIDQNQNALNTKFTNEFGNYLGSNLSAYYQTISQNLTTPELLTKLNNQDVSVKDVNAVDIEARNVYTSNLYVNSVDFNDIKSNVDYNKRYVSTLDKVFSFNGVVEKPVGVMNDELVNNPMVRIIKPGDITRGIPNDKDKTFDISPGVNINLKRDIFRHNDYQAKFGGKLFVDDWDDIGLNKYTSGSVNNPKSIDGYVVPNESLKTKFSNIDDRMVALSNNMSAIATDITNIQNGGMTKLQLYHLLNDYNSDTDQIYTPTYGAGRYTDKHTNSIRIKHLYAGEPSSQIECSQHQDNKKCLTVDERLTALEGVTTTAFGDNFASSMNEYGITLDSSQNLNITKNSKINGTLSVSNGATINGGATVNGDLNMNGSIYVGANPGDKLILQDINDLEYMNTSQEKNTFQDAFVKQGSDTYVQNIQSTPTGFKYKLGNDDERSIDFPTSDISVSTGDIKSLTQLHNSPGAYVNTFQYKNYGDPPSYTVDNLIHIPKQFVHSIEDSPTSFKINSFNSPSTTIDKGITTRGEILDKLYGPADANESIPNFSKGIRMEGGCIKIINGKLKLCDTTCGSCDTTIWDTNQAPDPNVVGSTPVLASS